MSNVLAVNGGPGLELIAEEKWWNNYGVNNFWFRSSLTPD
jgi:hypothetical protein